MCEAGPADMAGELSKREGVLLHWWPFSSKRNAYCIAVLHRYEPNMNDKTTNFVGYLFEMVIN